MRSFGLKWMPALVLVAVVLNVSACSRSRNEQEFPVTGVIVAPLEGSTMMVAHEPIPGFMPAMTMPFTLANPGDADRLSPGDRIRFTLVVGEDRSRAADVVVTGQDLQVLHAHLRARANEVKRLRPGDRVPAFALVDQDGNPVSEQDLSGRLTVLTFIFTRCPLPEFCPRITGRFRDLQQTILADPAMTSVRLLSVTLDPEYDTPPVLAEYGRAWNADFARWRFATGTPEQVAVLTRAFAVHVEASGGLIDHTLATALLDGSGQVVELWRGNVWDTQDVIDALHQHVRAD